MSLNDVDFTGRMQAGRDLAARERHLGRASSRPRFAKRPPADDTEENRLAAELAHLRGELRDRENTIAVLQQGGEPDAFGVEFDRLCAKAGRQGLPPLPSLSPCRSTTAARPRGSSTMNKRSTTTEAEHPSRAAARKMLEDGACSPAEAANIAGVSRQLMNHWAKGINWRKARAKALAAAWERALPKR